MIVIWFISIRFFKRDIYIVIITGIVLYSKVMSIIFLNIIKDRYVRILTSISLIYNMELTTLIIEIYTIYFKTDYLLEDEISFTINILSI